MMTAQRVSEFVRCEMVTCNGCEYEFEDDDLNIHDRCSKCSGKYQAYCDVLDMAHNNKTLAEIVEIIRSERLRDL